MNIPFKDESTQLIFLSSKLNLSYSDEYIQLTENIIESIVNYDIEVIKDILKNEINETQKSKEEEIKYYDNILKKIEDIFTSENYNTSNLDKGQDDYIKTKKMIVTFTTTENQRNNLNNNMTSIDLGDCENLLR